MRANDTGPAAIVPVPVRGPSTPRDPRITQSRLLPSTGERRGDSHPHWDMVAMTTGAIGPIATSQRPEQRKRSARLVKPSTWSLAGRPPIEQVINQPGGPVTPGRCLLPTALAGPTPWAGTRSWPLPAARRRRWRWRRCGWAYPRSSRPRRSADLLDRRRREERSAQGLTARTKALNTLPATCGASRSVSSPCPAKNAWASAALNSRDSAGWCVGQSPDIVDQVSQVLGGPEETVICDVEQH